MGKTPQTPPRSAGGMWFDDVVFGGEQLEPNVSIGDGTPYVLWDCGITAENVQTSIGDDGTKCELVLSAVTDPGENSGTVDVTEPRKFGTFASSIVSKIRKRQDGDLPAVIKFDKVASKSFDTDAFVMTFIRRWHGDVPADLPAITPIDPESAPY